jgi:ATP/maltotriose-dependent transcriptional regulator MalT
MHTVLTYLALAEALGGSAEGARAALAELDEMSMPGDDVNAVELRRARAWTEVAAGNMAAAHNHLREAAALARHRGDAVWESDVLHDLARLGWAEEAVDRLRELATTVEGDMISTRVAHVEALLADDVGALGRVSIAFESMGAWLLAAEAAAAAAVVRRRSGDQRRAAAAELRAAALARHCNGAITPALRAIETQALLSTREIEVAALAATGLANKEIAANLTVSVRTVENHLQRVYEKLGVARRADLAQALTSV